MAHIDQEIRTYELRTSDDTAVAGKFSARFIQDEMQRECAERLQPNPVERTDYQK